MLKHLKYKIEFLKPAKVLTGDHTFTTGLTGITGQNGKGKSMNLEMIQFALHGTEALRGKMEGYGKIEDELVFELKETTYKVIRTKSNAKLMWLHPEAQEWVDLAAGTKPVNAKIEELFGYSSDVFRVANACNQGKIEELGDMKPTARKQLIDETVGLNVLDDLTSFIDDERKRLKTGITAIEGILVAPVEPTKPELDKSAEWYKTSRDAMIKVRDERNLVSAAAARVLTLPPVVLPEPDDSKLGEYESGQQHRTNLLTEYALLKGQKDALPKPVENLVTELEADDGRLEEYQKVIQDAQALEMEIAVNKKGAAKYKWEEPLLSREEIVAYAARNDLVKRWEEKQALIKKRVPHDCPKCQHHWDDEDPRIKTEYADVPEEKPEAKYGSRELVQYSLDLEAKETATPILAHIEKLEHERSALNKGAAQQDVERILATRKAVADSKADQVVATRRGEITKRMQELTNEYEATTDQSERIKAINDQRKNVHRYEVQLEAYKVALKEKEEAHEKLLGFHPYIDEDISTFDAGYTTMLTYETNLVSYLKAKEAYDKSFKSLMELKAELLDWENGRDAVTDLRAKVKGYLLPSLNSVSSGLLNQMTGGELTWIVMNDQGEVAVEGQSLETLSGAGKAVANLALRIGLGMVLTNRVFSSLMLDEIDAACDEDRAKYIAGCLMNLTKTIKQIIQVSHKPGLPANQYVRL